MDNPKKGYPFLFDATDSEVLLLDSTKDFPESHPLSTIKGFPRNPVILEYPSRYIYAPPPLLVLFIPKYFPAARSHYVRCPTAYYSPSTNNTFRPPNPINSSTLKFKFTLSHRHATTSNTILQTLPPSFFQTRK